MQTADSAASVETSQATGLQEQDSAENLSGNFPILRSGESSGRIVLTEKERVILYESFEDSDEESSGPPGLESCPTMMSEPDFGENELSPAIHFTSVTPIRKGHRCTGNISRYSDDVFIEMQGEYSGRAGGCCVANVAWQGTMI